MQYRLKKIEAKRQNKLTQLPLAEPKNCKDNLVGRTV